MGSVNKVFLVGNLGRDAEQRHTANGTAVSNFSLATTDTWTDKSGQRQERTEWHRVVVWDRQAESLQPYLTKGKQICVEGRLQTREWNDRDGNKRYNHRDSGRSHHAARRSGRTGRRCRAARRGDRGGRGRSAGADRGRHPVLSGRRRALPAGTLRPRRSNSGRLRGIRAVLHDTAVSILESNHVIEIGRGHLEDVGGLEGGHAVHRARRDVDAVTRAHLLRDPGIALAALLEPDASAPDQDRLILDAVILEAERLSGIYVEDFSDVALGLGPAELVTPTACPLSFDVPRPPRRPPAMGPAACDSRSP